MLNIGQFIPNKLLSKNIKIKETNMINTFVAGILCGWLYMTYVVPNYAIKEVQQCTLKIGKTLVQGDAV